MTRSSRKPPPKPPAHLSPSSKTWWRGVVAEWVLDEHHLHLLRLAAESLDMGAQARRALHEHGFTFDDRFGLPRPRPEVAIVRDSRLGYARLLRELALDIAEPSDAPRSPAIGGNAGRRR